mmetsp:Transcript_15316/g.21691  ORF Transcript_15316/g.21691 Transcript_15316/m.21691 type:complete len:91 (+) Transcript_15316:1510-1782(+)
MNWIAVYGPKTGVQNANDLDKAFHPRTLWDHNRRCIFLDAAAERSHFSGQKKRYLPNEHHTKQRMTQCMMSRERVHHRSNNLGKRCHVLC